MRTSRPSHSRQRVVLLSSQGVSAGRHPSVHEDAITQTDLDWTILRPGGLTLSSGTGEVQLAEHTARGQVPREDVAAVLLALLDEPKTAGLSLDLVSGDVPIAEAVAALVGGS